MQQAIRLLLVDDELSIRRGLRMQFALEADLEVIGEASNGEEAMVMARDLEPDVIVMDLRMPGTDGLLATSALCAAAPATKVVMLSLFDDAANRARAAEAGARAFVGKHEPAGRLVETIRRVAASAS